MTLLLILVAAVFLIAGFLLWQNLTKDEPDEERWQEEHSSKILSELKKASKKND